jgi:hypothetical protein
LNTSTPSLISFHLIHEILALISDHTFMILGGDRETHLTTPALATLANGTSFDSKSFVVADTLNLGTKRVRDMAIATEVRVAAA